MLCSAYFTAYVWDATPPTPMLMVPRRIGCELMEGHDGEHEAHILNPCDGEELLYQFKDERPRA